VWHELAVECKGNQISCSLNGKQAIPTISDSTFTAGKIGFWTKSDSVSYFGETRVTYTPREPAIRNVVRETLETYPRLLGLKVFMLSEDKTTARVVASKEPSDLGQAGDKPEIDVITQGAIYYGKGKSSVAVTMPLRDRNGDIVAAVRVVMKSFPGQTEANAVERATPIVKQMQARIHSRQELVE
jgi:hypothetical protein